MITAELLARSRDKVDEIARELSPEDIDFLVTMLNEKNDDIRYVAFLILQKRSNACNDVYRYWNLFYNKLSNENTYQRSIGIMLLAQNVKWDTKNCFDNIAEEYLSHCTDEKFITSRQTIQSIKVWVDKKPNLHQLIIDKLINIDVINLMDTQRKLILTDIIEVFVKMLKIKHDEEMINYICNASKLGILDTRFVKKVIDEVNYLKVDCE